MKSLFSTLVAAFVLNALTAQAQQAPLYLLFNASCMNQLEYRYAYTGAVQTAYSFSPNANQTFILHAGNSGINAPSLPPGTLDCKDIRMDQAFLDAVNKLQRQVYMVHQTQQGYLLMPLVTAMQIERNASYYFFRSPNYTFALDTLNLVYQANLSAAGSPNYVYFTGVVIRDCVYQYTLHSEPTQTNREKSDFEFVPGIGIVSQRSGMTPSEAETNTMRLWYINGISVEDYINGMCNPGMAKTGTPKPPAAGGAKDPVNREDYLQKNRPGAAPAQPGAAPTAPAPTAKSACAEQNGDGYHIVQPGETLMSLSRTYKVPLKSLTTWNNIKNPDKISPCQKIYVRDPATVAKTPEQPKPIGPEPATIAKTPDPVVPKPVAIHTVRSGETVSGIARNYGFTEARFRYMNKMPATGDVTIYPGQQLIVSDCDAPQIYRESVDPTPATAPKAPPTTPPAAAPQTGTQPNDGANLRPLEFSTTPQQPVATQPANQFTETPVTQPTISEQVRKATYYQEYIVQQGDTMNSIAIKYKTTAQELALLNNKEPNEMLIAGQRILIPKQ